MVCRSMADSIISSHLSRSACCRTRRISRVKARPPPQRRVVARLFVIAVRASLAQPDCRRSLFFGLRCRGGCRWIRAAAARKRDLQIDYRAVDRRGHLLIPFGHASSRSIAFGAQPPDLRFAPLMDMDFAISCPLVRRWRLYPVFVHRLAPLIRASFRPRLAPIALALH